MQHKNPEYFSLIENFINDYKDTHEGRTPSTREIAAGVGLSTGTITNYMKAMRENGMLDYSGYRNVKTKRDMLSLANLCNVPVLGRVSCGIAKYAEENIEEYVKLPSSIFGKGNFFILRANGDSMINAGINDGDYVLIRQQSTAEYNQIVVALVDEDEATLKRFRPQADCIYLHPENPNYDDIVVDSCVIQGVAVKVIKDIW